jgi:hypothetical protein
MAAETHTGLLQNISLKHYTSTSQTQIWSTPTAWVMSDPKTTVQGKQKHSMCLIITHRVPCTLDLKTRCKKVGSLMLQLVYPKEPTWTPKPVWTLRRREKYHATARNQTVIPWPFSPYPSHWTEISPTPNSRITIGYSYDQY